jgi:Fe-S-cluster containining protein
MIEFEVQHCSGGSENLLAMFEHSESNMVLGNLCIPCFRCGVCCRKYHARLSHAEALEIADKLGIDWAEFSETYLENYWPGVQSFTIAHRNGSCIFLRYVEGYGGSCSIQAFKPLSCREWNPSIFRKECQEGLRRYWGLRVTPLGGLEGAEDNLRSFQSFLESLNSGGDKCQFTNTNAGTALAGLS